MAELSSRDADLQASEPKLFSPEEGPRLVLYAQTHDQDGVRVSLLPLVTRHTGITHVIIGCLHLHDKPGVLRLNDHDPNDERFDQLWDEVGQLQKAGVRVLLMTGGAAQGSYQRLSGDDASFEAFYKPVIELLRQRALDGIDLDIEEVVDLKVVRRLLLRIRQDMGPQFLVSMAPTASALTPDPNIPISIPVFGLTPSLPHLSGFSYFRLEGDKQLKPIISWYNTQFYCGWGDASTIEGYDKIIRAGWDPSRVVLGVVTNPRNGAGFVDIDALKTVIKSLRQTYPSFGGLMGWEYFNAGTHLHNGREPADWVKRVGTSLRCILPDSLGHASATKKGQSSSAEQDIEWLMEMGADRDSATGALEAANGNVEQAAELLFGT